MTNEELVKRIQAGNGEKEYIQQLWEQNLPFIKKIASQYSAWTEFDDLIQEAYFGLYTAAMKYDPQCGVLFLTYAGYWIQQKIMRYLQQNGSTVRIPAHMVEMLSKYRRVTRQFQIECGRKPTEKECASLLNISQANLDNLQRAVEMRNSQSLSTHLGESEDELGDFIPTDVNIENIAIHEVDHERMSRILWGIIAQLPERKRSVMEMRAEGFTLKEVEDAIGITAQRVSNIEADVRRWIRSAPEGKKLREYYVQYV